MYTPDTGLSQSGYTVHCPKCCRKTTLGTITLVSITQYLFDEIRTSNEVFIQVGIISRFVKTE